MLDWMLVGIIFILAAITVTQALAHWAEKRKK